MTYNSYHATQAANLVDVSDSTVLVVGCNTGGDCKLFADMGATEIHGLDVIDNVGHEYPHERIKYHRTGIEKTIFPSNSFDLIFSFATMEHVHDIEAGFAEMCRLARPGGFVYSVAAPLWHSPYGHHMGCFPGHPWVHVVMSPTEIVRYAEEHGITGERGHSIDKVVEYMTNPAYFNMRPSDDYVIACRMLTNAVLIRNELVLDETSLLDHPLGKKALELGFSRENLLAVSHILIAQKMPSTNTFVRELREVRAELSVLSERALSRNEQLARDLSERDGQIIGLKQQLSERHGQLSERDGQITGLKQQLSDAEGQLVNLRLSTSWRMTAPMRTMMRGLRSGFGRPSQSRK